MLILLIISEIVALAVLYYCKYVERITILAKYLKMKQQNNIEAVTLISKIIIRPYLLFIIIICLTVAWEISYANAILEHDDISHLILFYVIILPQIACAIFFEEELSAHPNLKILFYAVMVYLGIIGLIINPWLLYSGAAGTLLVYLSIRAGRMCLFMEYVAKFIMLVVVFIL